MPAPKASPAAHPYCSLCGGTEADLHGLETGQLVEMERPEFLRLHEDRTRRAKVVNRHGGSHSISFEVYGEGAHKVLMLHGLAATHTIAEPQIQYFGIDRASEFTLCVPDNRGVGLSETPSGLWTTRDIAADYLQLLIQLEQEDPGWSRNVHVIGFSMGGMVAQELILMAPSRFESLTLISTHTGGLVTAPPLHGWKPFLKTFVGLGGVKSLDAGLEISYPKEHLDTDIPDARPEGFKIDVPLTTNRLKYAYHNLRRARKFVESGNAPEIRLHGILRQVCAVLSHYVSWSRLDALRSWKLDSLVISGEHDNVVGPWNSRVLSEALCARWLHFADAGHFVIEQHADSVNEAIHGLISAAEARVRASAASSAAATSGGGSPAAPADGRKPCPPSLHPVKQFAAVAGLVYLLTRKRLLALALAAVVARKFNGGVFAK
mmetsp:Transcript_23109/g.43129  ORF Transcript_23109/g.43129 Transcript_23109/m.43129 type:complete len:434 (-) Transcript_23109:3-1304(-)